MPLCYRSSQSRSRPALVSVPASRPLSSSVTLRDTSVSASRPPRKSQLPSAPPSSSPSSPLSQSVADTGEPTLVLLTLSQPRNPESAVPSPSDLSQLPAVPVSSPPQLSSVFSSLLVLRTSTLLPLVPPRPLRTLSRLLSSLLATPTAT